MKRLVNAFLGLILMGALVSACKEDEEVVLSSDCYISNFSLGSLKRLVHHTDANGTDSSYYISFSGSYYPMDIDQVAQTILLQTPLPVGTRVDAVIATVSFEGMLLYRAWDDAAADTTWTTYNSADSIDFSQPLRFRVYASDGQSHKDYYVRLDCRTSEPSAYTWEKVQTSVCDETMARRLLPWGQSLFLMLQDEATDNLCYSQQSYASDGNTTALGKAWAQWVTIGGDSPELFADVRTLQLYRDSAWVSSPDGRELWKKGPNEAYFQQHCTFDGTQGLASLSLFAASGRALYGIGVTADGQRGVYSSADGNTWNVMALDADLALFPAHPVAVAYKQANGNERVLVAGAPEGAADGVCEVWSLLEDADEPWTYFPVAPDNPYRLPQLQDLNIIAYDGFLLAMGGASADGSIASLGQCYVSLDNGVTWRPDNQFTVPAELCGTPWRISATTLDGDIWLSAGAQLWRARLNSYGEN